MRSATLLALAPLIASACGGGSTPEDQIRSTEVKAIEALTGSHPEEGCAYTSDRDKCMGVILLAKAMNLDLKAEVGIPDDWRDRVRRAKITVTADTATLAPGPTGGTARFVYRAGRWLLQSS